MGCDQPWNDNLSGAIQVFSDGKLAGLQLLPDPSHLAILNQQLLTLSHGPRVVYCYQRRIL